MASHYFPLILNLLAFLAVLFVPLFLVPELLQRQGVVEWKARLVGWVAFPLLLLLVVAVATGQVPVSSQNSLLWLGAGGGIAFAAWWDLRRARRHEGEGGLGQGP
ncbi:MAG: hypothetical protein ACE5LS_05350 [Thermoplasmata archaeon]